MGQVKVCTRNKILGGDVSKSIERNTDRRQPTERKNRSHREGEKNSTNYIRTLVRFNKKELVLTSIQAIVAAFPSIVKDTCLSVFDGKELSMLFVGTKKYSIKYSDSAQDVTILWNLLLCYSDDLNAQEISNVLNSLNKMQHNFFDVMDVFFDVMDVKVKRCLVGAFSHNVMQFNHQIIANTLLALDLMRMKLGDIHLGLQDKMLKSIKPNSLNLYCQNLSIIIFSLDELGVEMVDLKNTLNVLIDSATRLCPTFSARDIIGCVNALDHLGFFWHDFPQDFQSKFWSCIKQCLSNMKPHERGMLILRLNRLSTLREMLEAVN